MTQWRLDGGGELILDMDLNGDLLLKTISALISKPQKIKQMEKSTSQLSILNGVDLIYNEICKLVNE